MPTNVIHGYNCPVHLFSRSQLHKHITKFDVSNTIHVHVISLCSQFSSNSIYIQISIYNDKTHQYKYMANGIENKCLKTYINSSPSR